MEGLSEKTLARDGNCLLGGLGTLLDDEGQYSFLEKKLLDMLEPTVTGKMFCHFIASDIIQNNIRLSINIKEDYKLYVGKIEHMAALQN
jgi:hypothetical protein